MKHRIKTTNGKIETVSVWLHSLEEAEELLTWFQAHVPEFQHEIESRKK